ncbi:protein RALF-like 33 [Canna indica]|uniref:Protein RALF-like 33 n=1 Tax=Canna indica TaxID=4628 RepID=A0AAQ3KZ57_9LILI|nr:protein RALF-like 33 [Canna indica]
MARRAAKASLLLLPLPLLLLLLTAAAAASGGGAEGRIPLEWIPSLAGCRGTIAECLAGEDELDLGLEATRRMLGTSDYISYGALKPDTTPCSQSGASYYNCRPGASANPYSRSCSNISNCRS